MIQYDSKVEISTFSFSTNLPIIIFDIISRYSIIFGKERKILINLKIKFE